MPPEEGGGTRVDLFGLEEKRNSERISALVFFFFITKTPFERISALACPLHKPTIGRTFENSLFFLYIWNCSVCFCTFEHYLFFFCTIETSSALARPMHKPTVQRASENSLTFLFFFVTF